MYQRRVLLSLALAIVLSLDYITGISYKKFEIYTERRSYADASEECKTRNQSLAMLNANQDDRYLKAIIDCSIENENTFWVHVNGSYCRYYNATVRVFSQSIIATGTCSTERYFVCERHESELDVRDGVKCPEEDTVSGNFSDYTLIDGRDDSVMTTVSIRLDDSSKTETVIAITLAAALFVLITVISVVIFLKRRSGQREANGKADEHREHGGERFNRETPDGTTATLQNNYLELEPQNEAPCNSNYEEPPEEVCDYVSTPDDVYDELRKKRGKIQADTGGPYESLGKDYTYDVTSDIHKRTFPEMITENEYSGFRGDTYDTAGKRTNVQINNSPYDSITVFKET